MVVSNLNRLKIVIPDKKTISVGDVSFDCFKQFGDVVEYDLSGECQIAKRIECADVILCNKTPMNEKTLGLAKNLKYIGLFATGYNNVDLEYTAKRNITVCNAADYSTNAVAQHTFALILELASRVSEYNSFVREGGWIKSDVFSPFIYKMTELSGKTIGIVGMGSIGTAVAKIAVAFNMNVLYYSRSEKIVPPNVKRVSLVELVSSSDFVTVHCPLNGDSKNMFDESLFSCFKKGSVFINTSRGGVVDELALKKALDNGTLHGAAVDVLSSEPMSENCPLIGCHNIIITPHVAWAPTETRQRLIEIVCSNLRAFLSGEPKNVVNR